VQQACRNAGYPGRKLEVVHNGLPILRDDSHRTRADIFRIGFLGAFSERKGLGGFLAMVERFAAETKGGWRAEIGGAAQDEAARALESDLLSRYSDSSCWNRVRWHGWVNQADEFPAERDQLICPSSDFDPFPTVLLEAGRQGVGVLAADVGGVAEIVVEGADRLAFLCIALDDGANILIGLGAAPAECHAAGGRAAERVAAEFSVGEMIENCGRLYSTLLLNNE